MLREDGVMIKHIYAGRETHEQKGGMEVETQTSKVKDNQWEGGAKGGIVGGLKVKVRIKTCSEESTVPLKDSSSRDLDASSAWSSRSCISCSFSWGRHTRTPPLNRISCFNQLHFKQNSDIMISRGVK